MIYNISNIDISSSNQNDITEDYVHLGTEGLQLRVTTIAPESSSDEHENLRNIILASILGPLGVILIISYIIHWYQVIQRVQKMHEQAPMESQHTSAAKMLSIKTFENQRSETMYDGRVGGAQYISIPEHNTHNL